MRRIAAGPRRAAAIADIEIIRAWRIGPVVSVREGDVAVGFAAERVCGRSVDPGASIRCAIEKNFAAVVDAAVTCVRIIISIDVYI